MNKKKLNKFAMFTDLHVGAKANSEQHNQDCHDYIDWFCDNVRADTDIDHIIFGGDWHEVRNSINIFTLKHSYDMAKKINELGLPVYFIIGNHDLYHKSNRDIYSTYSWEGFDNFIMVDEPMVVENMGDGVLLCPYLFHEEYPKLAEYKNIPMWVGHFEFKGFIVTGYNITMKSGPDHSDFSHQKRIVSGHFHKRQTKGNTTYIGNTFPTSFADAGDFERGMMIYNHDGDEMSFLDWEDCPKYISGNLSTILDEKIELYPNARVKVVADIPISYEESIEIRKTFIENHNLREFVITESTEIQEALEQTETEVEVELDGELGTVDEMVVDMLGDIDSEHIDNELLIQEYINL
jgi:DNA repair exonuclease SbcCD nuclease subunit